MSLCEPNCPLCHGLGWGRRDRPVSDPKFGQLEYCPNINPVKIFGKKSGLELHEFDLSWVSFADVNGINSAIRIVEQMLDRGYGIVYLWGDVGLGKTTILKTIVAECIQTWVESSYCRMSDILNDLKAAFSIENSGDEFNRRMAYYLKVPVLCIDEFNRVNLTNFVEEQRFSILDQRYQDALRKKSITVIASNESPKKLDNYLADRFFDGRMQIIHLEGISTRPNISTL